MLDSGLQDNFNDLDLLITVEVEELVGRIQINAETIRPTSSGIIFLVRQYNGTLAQ